MAKGIRTGSGGSKELNYTFKVDTSDFEKKLSSVTKKLSETKVEAEKLRVVKTFDVKPLTEYQAGLLKIKQEALDLAKQKAAQAKADRDASLATQAALKEEARLRRELVAQAKMTKRPTVISDSAPEVANFNASTTGTNGTVNTAFTSYLKEVRQDFDAGKISAAQYVAELERYSTVVVDNARSTQQLGNETKKIVLSKKELAKMLAEEKYQQQQNTAALKNNAREMLNAKGSVEQRRAALIRLQSVYDRLSVSERNSASGARLDGIIGRVATQVKDLEASTLRFGRNVGNYPMFDKLATGASKAFGYLRNIANILPAVGIGTIVGFISTPILEYIASLDLFKKRIDQIVESRKELSGVNLKGAQDAQTELVHLKVLMSTIKDQTSTLTAKKEAMKVLQDQYPTTFKNYTLEQVELGKVDKAYQSLTNSIIATARARASEAKIAENSIRQLSDEEAVTEERINNERLRNAVKNQEALRKISRNSSVKNAQAAQGEEVATAETLLSLKRELEESDKKILGYTTDRNILENRNLALEKNIKVQQGKGAKIDDKKTTAAKVESDPEYKAQRELQAKFDKIATDARRKRISEDEAEIQAVKDKYKILFDEAVKFNDDVDKYNNNPKNKNKTKRTKVDTSGLIVAQSIETDFTIDKQAATTLKTEIDLQKNYFNEFEKYKLEVGAQNAEKLIGDKKASEENYLEYLKRKENELTDPQKSKGGDGGGIPVEQQLKVIRDQIKITTEEKKRAEDEVFLYAYKSAETSAQKIEAINADYALKRKALGESATTEQLANLAKERDNRIMSENEANAYAKSGYEDLMAHYDELTRGTILKRLKGIIAGYDAEYKAGKLTADQLAKLKNPVTQQVDVLQGNNSFNKLGLLIKQYKKDIAGTDKDNAKARASFKELAGGIAASAQDINAVLGSVAGALGDLNIGGEGLQETFKNVQGAVDGISGIAKGLETGNPVDIITGSIKFLTSAIAIFNTKDKKLEKQIQGYRDQLDALGVSYKQLERDVQNAVGESVYSDQAKQIENLKQQQIALTQARDAERSKKKADSGKIAEFQNQIDSIPGQIEEIQKSISQSLIQTTFKDLSNSLADAFTDAFKAGENGIKSMDSVFDDFIGNAIKNSLKLKLIEPIIAGLTKDLTLYAQGNNNSIIGFDFDGYKAQIAAAQKEFTAVLEANKALFTTAATTNTTSTASSTGIARTQLTEDTGQRIYGIMRAQYDETKRININLLGNGKTLGALYQSALDAFAITVKIEANTFRTANNTERLAAIEKSLSNIDSNTKSTVTTRGAGI